MEYPIKLLGYSTQATRFSHQKFRPLLAVQLWLVITKKDDYCANDWRLLSQIATFDRSSDIRCHKEIQLRNKPLRKLCFHGVMYAYVRT